MNPAAANVLVFLVALTLHTLSGKSPFAHVCVLIVVGRL